MYKKRKTTYIGKDGYRKFSDSQKSVARHVAEQILGRKLRKGEVVHHKNRNKSDNRRSNLRIFRSQAEHYRCHERAKQKYGHW